MIRGMNLILIMFLLVACDQKAELNERTSVAENDQPVLSEKSFALEGGVDDLEYIGTTELLGYSAETRVIEVDDSVSWERLYFEARDENFRVHSLKILFANGAQFQAVKNKTYSENKSAVVDKSSPLYLGIMGKHIDQIIIRGRTAFGRFTDGQMLVYGKRSQFEGDFDDPMHPPQEVLITAQDICQSLTRTSLIPKCARVASRKFFFSQTALLQCDAIIPDVNN